MEYALWNGERISAFEVSKNYQLEKQVRQASGKKQLICPDKDCENPILRYCHGEKKEAYFAHLNNNLCDYSEFDRNNTDIVRSIRRRFCDHFKSIGLNVELEIKILKHHYTHLLITTDSGKQIAVEFGTQRLSANYINRLSVEYQKQNIPVKWIVIGNINHSIEEDKVFFLKRYLLNESTNKDLIIVSWNAEEVAQYKIDPNEYKYKSREIRSENYPKDFKKIGKIEDVILDGEELSITGFHDDYNKWLTIKNRAYNKRIAQLEEEERKREELAKSIMKRPNFHKIGFSDVLPPKKQTEYSSPINRYSPSELSTQKGYYEVKDKFTQQLTPIRDSNDRRWVKCEKCGEIKLDSEFSSYGGTNRVNLGICSACERLKRQS